MSESNNQKTWIPTNERECSLAYNAMLEYAMKKHAGATYDKGAPYIVHCVGVSNVANRFGVAVTDLDFGFHVHMACIGHDLIEDAGVKYCNLKAVFGDVVAELIYLCTDEKGRYREEVNAKTWPELAKDHRAVTVKLCDRIFNMETSLANSSHQLTRYVNEYAAFKKALYCGDDNKAGSRVRDRLWEYLDSLHLEGTEKIHARAVRSGSLVLAD